MVVMKVTPIRNVILARKCFKSDKPDFFFSKVVLENAPIDVYDIADRKQKVLPLSEISARKHRIIINNKKFFICSISKVG